MPVDGPQGVDLSVSPGRPVRDLLRRHRLDQVDGRGRPQALASCIADAMPAQAPMVNAARDADQCTKPSLRLSVSG